MVSIAAIGIKPILLEIEYKKFSLYWSIMQTTLSLFLKTLFVNRLIRFGNNPVTTSGIILDLYGILVKYDLTGYIDKYQESSVFPSKLAWKNVIRIRINNFDDSVLKSKNTKLSHRQWDALFKSYRPCYIWTLQSKYPWLKRYLQKLVYIPCKLFSFEKPRICSKCTLLTEHPVAHLILHCICNNSIRYHLWKSIIGVTGIAVFNELKSQSPVSQVVDLLGGLSHYGIDSQNSEKLLLVVARDMYEMVYGHVTTM